MLKTTLTDRRLTAAGLTAAAAALIAVCCVAFVRTSEASAAENAVESIYRRALYETCEYTEKMAVNLNKLTIAGGSSRSVLLSDIVRQAQGAQSNIAMLPLNSRSTAKAMKYINQVGDFCNTMLMRISSGGSLTQSEYADITRLSETAAAISLGFGTLLDRHEAGQIVLSMSIDDVTGDIFADTSIDYPTLLYDGPFSDGASGNDFKALDGLREVSPEEAAVLLQEFTGADSVRYESESDPGTPCYEFTVNSGGHSMSAAVTRIGGQLLYMLSSGEVGDAVLSDVQCFDIAKGFLLSRGFGDMEISYYSRYGGVMTINFAAAQNGVILYPDLIKLQISMSDGAVIGMEAGNYLRNHTQRTIELPAISESDARALVSPKLDIESVRLCMIPVGLGEKYCYEISASTNDSTYLIYLDAMTGNEVEIMQVISDSDSTLVM